MNRLIYNYADAPTYFAKCVAEGCKAAENCLRYQAAQALMERESHLWVISPAHIRPQEGEACPYFVSIEPVRVARGFKRALGSLRADQLPAAKSVLMSLYTRRTYYKLLNGEIALNAEKQRRIAAILTRYGAEQPITFDNYEEVAQW